MQETDASVLESLTGNDEDAALRAIRKVKNQIIGNKQKKLAYLRQGAVPKVLDLLNKHKNKQLCIQAAVALASFSYRTVEGSRELNEQNGVESLLAMLSSSDNDVVEAGARALKMVFQCPMAPVSAACHEPTRARLVALLERRTGQVAETVAAVLARCWQSREIALSYESTPAVKALVALLLAQLPPHGSPAWTAQLAHDAPPNPSSATQRAALEALGALAGHSLAASRDVVDESAVMEYLVVAVRSRDARTRLLACGLLTNLLQMSGILDRLSLPSFPLSPTTPAPPPPPANPAGPPPKVTQQHSAAVKQVQMLMLPVLVKLLAHEELRADVPPVLARLMAQQPELQRAVADSDAISRLSTFLLAQVQSSEQSANENDADDGGAAPMATDTSSPPLPSAASSASTSAASTSDWRQQRQAEQLLGTLDCVSFLCDVCDKNRESMCRPQMVGALIKGMGHRSAGVRRAVAHCLRVLARNQRAAKLDCFNEPALASGLVAMLNDEDVTVRREVCLALCNLGQPHCSTRKRLLEEEVVQKVIALTTSDDEALLANALWAVANFMDAADQAMRRVLMREAPWPRLRALLTHRNWDVAHHAWRLLQNFVKPIKGGQEFMREMLAWTGPGLLQLLADVLDGNEGTESMVEGDDSRPDESRPIRDARHVKCAMWVTTNLAAGWSEEKMLIINSPILHRLPYYLLFSDADSDQALEVRIATATLIINMLWLEPKGFDQSPPSPEQIKIVRMVMQPLQQGDLLEALEALKDHHNRDLSEQCRCALCHISKARECLEQSPAHAM